MPSHHRAVLTSLLAAALLPSTAFATLIPGGNLFTQTWTAAGSPYQVQGDITIPAGVTLTIEPGTLVQFALTDDQSSGADATRVEVILAGTLDVNGTSGSPVAFESVGPPSLQAWYGIRALSTATSCDLSNVRIRHAQTGIYHQGGASVLALSNVDIDDCNGDLNTVGGGAISLSGTLRASRIVGPLTVPSGCRFEHNGGQAGTVGVLTMEPGSTYAASARGQFDSDRMFTVSPITLAGTLELDVSACTLTAGQQAILFANSSPDPVSGGWDSHPEGSYIPVAGSLALRVSYVLVTGNDVGVVAEDVTGVRSPPFGGPPAILAARPNPAVGPQVFPIRIPAFVHDARFEIVDPSGRRVWRAPESVGTGASGEIAWDGRDGSGRNVGPGIYLARLVVEGRTAATRRVARIR